MARLIDADALIRKMCFRCKDGDGEGMCAEFCRFIAALDNTPTIDAVPVVHGRWIDKTMVIAGTRLVQHDCSNCGAYFWRLMTECAYCPNCGAKMDAKEEQ